MSGAKILLVKGHCKVIENDGQVFLRHAFGFDILCIDQQQAGRIATAINEAHKQGRAQLQDDLRSLLRIED